MISNIQEMMNDCINSLKTALSSTTAVGEAFTIAGSIVVPVSKITFALIAGGGEYADKSVRPKQLDNYPCTGGSGALVTITPLGFLVSGKDGNSLIKFDESDGDRLMGILSKVSDSVFKKKDK